MAHAPQRSYVIGMTEVDVGARIGNYLLKRRLGRGQFGVVFEAEHYRNPRIRVAVKVFDPVGCESGEERDAALAILEKEAESLHGLQHPGIVAFHDLILDASVQAVILEFLDGCDLKVELREKGVLPADEVILILEQVLEGLSYAHERGIVHRDLKPANIFHCLDGRFKIVDFGMARCTDGSQGSRTHGVKGSPWYLAPEQLYERVLPASDVYALGVTTWELLVGRNPCPFTSTAALLNWILTEPIPDLKEHAPEVPSWLVELVRCFTIKDEKVRPKDGKSAIETFRALKATSLATQASPVHSPRPTMVPTRGEDSKRAVSPEPGGTIIPEKAQARNTPSKAETPPQPAQQRGPLTIAIPLPMAAPRRAPPATPLPLIPVPLVSTSAEESADDIDLPQETQVEDAPLRKGFSWRRKLLFTSLALLALGVPGVLAFRPGGRDPGVQVEQDLSTILAPLSEFPSPPAVTSVEPVLEPEPPPKAQAESVTLPSRPSTVRRTDNRKPPVDAPAPEPATVEPVVKTGTVAVKGVKSAVLRGASGSYPPGQVPEGTYDLSVVFTDGRRIERPGLVVVKADQSTTIRCDAGPQNCR